MIKGLAFAALVFTLPTLPPLPPAGSSLSPMRMTPEEITAGTYDGKPGGPAAAGVPRAAGAPPAAAAPAASTAPAAAAAPAAATAPAATVIPEPAGIRTRVLFGDPAGSGAYAILLFVPPRTTVPAHSHRDDRMATVVAGVWRVGYGMEFDETALKVLPAGSVYSEPRGVDHFARTDDGPVVVQISGYGPTDTRDAEPPDDTVGEDGRK